MPTSYVQALTFCYRTKSEIMDAQSTLPQCFNIVYPLFTRIQSLWKSRDIDNLDARKL